MMMEKKLFLSDDPIKKPTEDAFGHKAFVDTLYTCIKDCDSKINIGLFGKWGVGKTSIVNLLITKLKTENQRIKPFLFDAWKYSSGSLRHELVLRLNKEFKILDQEELEREIYGIQEEEAPSAKEDWRKTLQRVWARNSVLIVATALLFGLLTSLYYTALISISHYTTLLFIVFLPLAVTLIQRVNAAVSPMRKVKALPAKFDPERLKNVFGRIVHGIVKKKADRLVIVIDNLDRCSGEAAIEMLEAIKCFMEHDKCVYLIPCDDNALVKHLVSLREYEEKDAREFLRKFFQASFTIPSLLEQDLERFAIAYSPA